MILSIRMIPCLVLAMGATALAQTGETLSSLIVDLGDPDPLVRERSTRALSGPAGGTVRTIEEALQQPGLSPEQRERLERVARRHFFDSVGEPRAALGIQLNAAHELGVEVTNTIDGFDAKAVLLVGDVIRSFAGYTTTEVDLRHAIISFDPGDAVELMVLRNNREVQVQVRLGSFRDLGNAGVNSPLLQGAWELRVARRRGAQAPEPPLDCGLDEQGWDQARARAQTADAADRRRGLGGAWPEAPATTLLVGGQTHPGDDDAGGRGIRRPAPNQQAAQLFAVIAETQQAIEVLTSRVESYERRMNLPDTPPRLREQLRQNILAERKDLLDLERDLERYRQELIRLRR